MDQPPTPLPPVADLRFCSEAVQEAVLDLLFEPSPAIHSLLVPVVQMGNHASYDELIDACRQRLRRLLPPCPAGNCGDCTGVANRAEEASTTALLMAVIGSHPRLGAKHVGSVQSAAEQASLRGEGEALAALNSEYEEKFSGLRYVVFVNGRDRADIMRDMRARIDRGDYAHEVETALEAMYDIAKDRASKLHC